MESPPKPPAALFEVYLRLRPAAQQNQLYPTLPTHERFITVEEATDDAPPTYITLNPPNDKRRRAVEKFAFTQVFEENADQLDVFQGTGVLPLVEGVLGTSGRDGRDGLLATLGVTGSGKTHTMLGSRSQRGLTQLALDVLFRSISNNILDTTSTTSLHATLAASDPSEAQVMSAHMFIETIYGDSSNVSRATSRAPTPMVGYVPALLHLPSSSSTHQKLPHSSYNSISAEEPENSYVTAVPAPSSHRIDRSLLGLDIGSPESINNGQTQPATQRVENSLFSHSPQSFVHQSYSHSYIPYMQSTFRRAVRHLAKSPFKCESNSFNNNQPLPTPRRYLHPRTSIPSVPDISNLTVEADSGAEYAILISMYEVYNDRIFDLLTPASLGKSYKDPRRRPLLYKHTEGSTDRKVVAGLRKIICGTSKDALMVLEAGLHERRVAGTVSNSVSSRSHGFFVIEVKKRRRSRMPGPWGGSALTIVDLAGSERARDAKTAGTTLAEAGKINESLMYLGQCLQMQSDMAGGSTKPNLVPFRQCKLTELLFSNSFPSPNQNAQPNFPHQHHNHYYNQGQQRNPQKAIMIVTADPLGDFNATSQILRYSALAREITIPRIPSVSSTILAQTTASHFFSPSRPGHHGRGSPTETERETMEIAALEIARMSEEIDGLRAELAAELQRRIEVEAALESLESSVDERLLEAEADVRESICREMEERFEREARRWRDRFLEEGERVGVHLDRKLDVFGRGLGAGTHVDVGAEEDKENLGNASHKQQLEAENERLRREVRALRREVHCKSPTKVLSRLPLRDSRTYSTPCEADEKTSLRSSPVKVTKSPRE